MIKKVNLFSPSAQYECAMYANQQNLERLKTTVQQESMLMSNMNLNSSLTTNILKCKFGFFNFHLYVFCFSSDK
jgi:hypothetical protein